MMATLGRIEAWLEMHSTDQAVKLGSVLICFAAVDKSVFRLFNKQDNQNVWVGADLEIRDGKPYAIRFNNGVRLCITNYDQEWPLYGLKMVGNSTLQAEARLWSGMARGGQAQLVFDIGFQISEEWTTTDHGMYEPGEQRHIIPYNFKVTTQVDLPEEDSY